MLSLDIDKILRCPFRTETFITQEIDNNGNPKQIQLVTFPECHYNQCPFYNPNGKEQFQKCFKSTT